MVFPRGYGQSIVHKGVGISKQAILDPIRRTKWTRFFKYDLFGFPFLKKKRAMEKLSLSFSP